MTRKYNNATLSSYRNLNIHVSLETIYFIRGAYKHQRKGRPSGLNWADIHAIMACV